MELLYCLVGQRHLCSYTIRDQQSRQFATGHHSPIDIIAAAVFEPYRIVGRLHLDRTDRRPERQTKHRDPHGLRRDADRRGAKIDQARIGQCDGFGWKGIGHWQPDDL
jgi:hypothetical protein